MKFIETESGDLINLDKVVLVSKDSQGNHCVYVHMFLEEFRCYPISDLVAYKIKNQFAL